MAGQYSSVEFDWRQVSGSICACAARDMSARPASVPRDRDSFNAPRHLLILAPVWSVAEGRPVADAARIRPNPVNI